jgi:TolB-like protein
MGASRLCVSQLSTIMSCVCELCQQSNNKEIPVKNLKVLAGFAVIMALAGPGGLNAQSSVSLDEGIRQSALEIEGKLAEGSKIVVLNFTAPSARFADYVIEELTGYIANGGKLIAVDRQNLALIQQELNFQLSGEVSDDSAQEIGRKLGAQSIVSGSIEDLGFHYRLRFRVVEVVSAAIQLQPSKNVDKDTQTAILMGIQVPQISSPAGAVKDPAAVSVVAAGDPPQSSKFSAGRRAGAGFLNLFLGLGSFTMGDGAGGLIVGGLEIVSISMLWPGIELARRGETTGVVLAAVGAPVALFYIIFNFLIPADYKGDVTAAPENSADTGKLNNPMKNIHIAMIPDGKGAAAMNFTWAFRY